MVANPIYEGPYYEPIDRNYRHVDTSNTSVSVSNCSKINVSNAGGYTDGCNIESNATACFQKSALDLEIIGMDPTDSLGADEENKYTIMSRDLTTVSMHDCH